MTQNTGAPGEGVSVRIRGAGSINSGNDPLYIVDGIPTADAFEVLPRVISRIFRCLKMPRLQLYMVHAPIMVLFLLPLKKVPKVR